MAAEDTLVAALARAKQTFAPVKKSKTARVPTKSGGEYSYAYADLSDVLDAVTGPLAAEGVVVMQPIQWLDDGVVLETLVCGHGDQFRSVLPLDIKGMQPQAIGSLLTYMRRYTLCSMLGIAAEEDDDGRQAQDTDRKYGSTAKRKAQAKVTETTRPRNTDTPPPDGEALSFAQLVEIKDWFDGMPDDVRKARKRQFVQQLGDPQTLRADQWPAVQAFMTEEPFDV
jgi:hypothetical protein